MNINFKPIVLHGGLWLLLLPAWSVAGADRYVTQRGIPPNTNSLAGLNAWTNVNPGDVVHLIGTFTNGIDTSAGFVGAPGNPVTFYFEPDANFTAPAWGQKFNAVNSYPNGNAFYLPNVNAVIIDGGSNGLIQATANGAGWLQWSNRCDGLNLTIQGGSFEIKNLTLSNLYVRHSGLADAFTPGHAGDGNYLVSGNGIVIGGGFTNSSIHNCNLTGTANLIAINYSLPTDNVQIYSNNLSHCSFGIQVYGVGYAGGTGWKIWKNNINIGEDWSGNNTYFHGDGIICDQSVVPEDHPLYDPAAATNYYTNGVFTVTLPQWGNYGSYYNWFQQGNANNTGLLNGTNLYTATTSFFAATNTVTLYGRTNALVTARLSWLHGATNVGMEIFQNTFGPAWGTNTSAWFGIYDNMPSGFQKYRVYNNLLIIDNITTRSTMANSLSVRDDCLIANNTMVQLNPTPLGGGFTAGFGGGQVYNNLLYNFNHAVSFNTTSTDSRGWGWFNAINYNVYYGISEWMAGQGAWPAQFYNPAGFPPIFGPGVAIYRRSSGYDNHSATNRPQINLRTYAPLSTDTVLVGKGMNLTSLGITNDFYGNPRPATGPWTIGAIEVPFSGTSLIAPSSLRVTNN